VVWKNTEYRYPLTKIIMTSVDCWPDFKIRVPMPESPGFCLKICRTWKVMENGLCTRKSRNLPVVQLTNMP